MRALVTILGLLAAPAALAGSELQLKSSMPVVLVLDGENKGTVQPMEPLLIDIESGVHELQLKGVLGKTLYERELIFDDRTRTELVWQRRDLRLGGVVKLDEESEEAVAESEDAEEPAEVTPPPAAEPEEALAVPAEAPEVEAAATPADTRPELERPEAPPVKTPPPKAPPVVKDVRAPRPPAAASAGSVVIEATPGMDLTITHGAQRLRVTVENGELVVEDANGTEIHFPTDGDAW